MESWEFLAYTNTLVTYVCRYHLTDSDFLTMGLGIGATPVSIAGSLSERELSIPHLECRPFHRWNSDLPMLQRQHWKYTLTMGGIRYL